MFNTQRGIELVEPPTYGRSTRLYSTRSCKVRRDQGRVFIDVSRGKILSLWAMWDGFEGNSRLLLHHQISNLFSRFLLRYNSVSRTVFAYVYHFHSTIIWKKEIQPSWCRELGLNFGSWCELRVTFSNLCL